jgi:hypothetical protein
MGMSRLKNAMSKDKLAENGTAKDEHTIHFDSPEKAPQAKTDLPRRSKSLRHKKGKRSASIGKMLDTGDGKEKAKKMPDRECIVM